MKYKERFQYKIFVDGKLVWKGLNLKKKFDEIKKKYPKNRVSIAWESDEGVLIA